MMKNLKIFIFLFFLGGQILAIADLAKEAYADFKSGYFEQAAEKFVTLQTQQSESNPIFYVLEAESYRRINDFSRLEKLHLAQQNLIETSSEAIRHQWKIYAIWLAVSKKSWHNAQQQSISLLKEKLTLPQKAQVNYLLALSRWNLKSSEEIENPLHQALLFAPLVSQEFHLKVIDFSEQILLPRSDEASLKRKEKIQNLAKKLQTLE